MNIFDSTKVYRYAPRLHPDQIKTAFITNTVDTNAGLYLELTVAYSYGEGEPFNATDVKEYYYASDLIISIYEEDNK